MNVPLPGAVKHSYTVTTGQYSHCYQQLPTRMKLHPDVQLAGESPVGCLVLPTQTIW